MANLKDVARIAGVTPTTVSRVLNNRGYISKNTREAVYAAMKQLNYQPNRIARSLKSNRSDIIAILVPDSGSMFYSGLIRQVEWECRKRDKRLLLCNSYTDPNLEREYVKTLNGQNVDGLIVCSHKLEFGEYDRLPFNVVTFDRELPGIPMVTSDNFSGGRMAAEKLIAAGCRRLLHISGPLTNARLAGHDRYRGFADYCDSHGVKYELFQTDDRFEYNYYSAFVSNRLKGRLNSFDGAFCSNDMLAYALYLLAKSENVDVPGSLKIVGFDNSQFVRILAEPKITVVAQDEYSIAENLVKIVLDPSKAPPVTTVPVHLVEGTTTE